MRGSETARWFATGWAFILFLGLSYYIYRSWRRRTVTLLGRSRMSTFSRDSEPLFYIGTLLLYTLIAGGLLFLLCLRAYYVTKEMVEK